MRGAAVLLLALVSGAAAPQAWPSKPIRVLVPFVAGAGGDLSARLMATTMAEGLGQPLVLENRPGAGESIAAETVARAAPDGYTILFCSVNAIVFRPNLAKTAPYDPVRDFTPIVAVGGSTAVIIVNPSLPVSSLQELIAYAKANPGKLSYGTSGIGTSHHLAAEQLALITGAQMVHVPYKSGIQPLNDVMAGLIPVSYVILSTLAPQLKSGKTRPIALTTARRVAALPGVPTIAEVLPNYVPSPSWLGLLAPAGLPAPMVSRLHAEASKVMNRPDTRAKLEAAGLDVVPNTPEEFRAEIRREHEAIARIVKATGIQSVE